MSLRNKIFKSRFNRVYRDNKELIRKHREEEGCILYGEKERREFIKKYRIKSRFNKRPITNIIINIFYDNPQLFFTKYRKTLKNSTYFDICGNSIFIHYFYILHEEHKLSKTFMIKNYIINNKILSNINIYIKYFDEFFKENKNNLLIQDLSLETPLHKIAKFHDKSFFVKIIQKLNFSSVLSEKLLSIKNANNETCLDFIIREIKDKYGYYINNDHEYNILKNCIMIIKNESYSSFFNNLSIEKKMIINIFILKNNYILQKRQIFDNLYSYIVKILNNEKDVNIFEYIYNPYHSGINYLNILFGLCKSYEDFNKLLHLVNQLLEIKDNIPMSNYDKFNGIFELLSIGELCFLDHLRYILGRMDSPKNALKYEINYCIQLIKNNFQNIIKFKDETHIISILDFELKMFNIRKKPLSNSKNEDTKHQYKIRKNIIYILLLNSNLSFDKKEEILSILNDVTNGIIYKTLDEYFSIYTFFKIVLNSKETLTQLYNKNIYISKIIKDFAFIGNLYEFIFYICDNYDKTSLDKYIELLNNFIIKGDPILLNNYKRKYNMSNSNIKELLNIIYIYKKENYSGTYENKNESLSEIEEEAKVNFILLDNKLSEYTLLDNFQRNKNDVLALKIVFSFKYDFCEYIHIYQEQIMILMKDNLMKFSKYLLNLDTLENNFNKGLENKLIKLLIDLLPKNNLLLGYNKSFKIKKNNYLKLYFLYDIITKTDIANLDYFIYICMKNLLNNWNKPINLKNIFSYIEKNIPLFWLYLISKVDNKVQIIKIFNFFFEDFLLLLNPEFKKSLEFYKNICYDYILNFGFENNYDKEDVEEVEEEGEEKVDQEKGKQNNSIESYENNDKTFDEFGNYKEVKNYYGYIPKIKIYYKNIIKKKRGLIKKNINKRVRIEEKSSFLFIMMLINIKIKYGDYNPDLLFNICKKFNLFDYAFFDYINISHENLKKKDIIANFFLTKNSSDEPFELKLNKYISANVSNLKRINHSFLINFIIAKNTKLIDNYQLEEFFSVIPLFKLNNIQENNFILINKIIKNILKKKVFFLSFLIEDYKLINDDKIEKIILLIKFISKHCYNKFKKKNPNIDKYEFFFINKFMNEKDKYNIFINLNRLFNILKKLNITLYECLSDNFIFLGETISLFLFIYFQILNHFYYIKKMKKEINFVINEINEFIISFYKSYKDKAITKKAKIYECYKIFFPLLIDGFYSKINFLKDKKKINEEFYLLDEIVQFTFDKNIDDIDSDEKYKGIIIKFYFIQSHNIKPYMDHYSNNYILIDNVYKRNKIMKVIIDKAPEIFIEISEFFRKNNGRNNFVSEVNLLIKKNSKFSFPYMSSIYSLINSSTFNGKYNSKTFFKPYYSLNQLINTMNVFLIKKILFLIKRINNINEEINLSENDIFRNKQFSIKLLDCSLPKEKIDYIINKILILYCEEKYEIFFIEIIKENIINKYVLDFALNNLTEEQTKQLFVENKAIIIKSLYRYSEINGYYFIQILLDNLEKCYPDKKFITNLIFPPKSKDEFDEMLEYFTDENIFENDLKPKSKIEKSVNDEYQEISEEPEFKLKNTKFLYNYSSWKNMVINYETKAFLFKYYSSSINILDLYPELFYCFAREDLVKPRTKLQIRNPYRSHFYARYSFGNADRKFTSNEYKVFSQVNNLKKKELIKSLNPFYYKICEFTESMYYNAIGFLQKLNSMESKIFKLYITIFCFKKIPIKLKKMLYIPKINKDSFDFESLIKENDVEDNSLLNELEIFIILALLEIKGENVISIKENFPGFFNKIENEYKKYTELNIPEIEIRQPDENFIKGIKYLLTNDMDNFMNNLKYNFNCYNLIFILEKNNNIFNKEISSEKQYLEKIIYKLITNNENNSLLNKDDSEIDKLDDVQKLIFSLKDFKRASLELVEKNRSKSKVRRIKYYFNSENYRQYLLNILTICDYILRKFINDNEYKLNLFNSKIFLHDYSDAFEKMKKSVSVIDIKNYIVSLYDDKILKEGKGCFDIYIKKWMDDYLNSKSIKDIIHQIEKENSSFIKYFKFLKLNCIALYNFVRRIPTFDPKECFIDYDYLYNYYNRYDRYDYDYYSRKRINFLFKEEKDKNKSLEILKTSLKIISKDFIEYLDDYSEKFTEVGHHLCLYNEPVNIPYYYNDDKGDYVETCTNLDLYFFITMKISSIYWFIYCNLRFEGENSELITTLKNINNKNINYIINKYWNHCKFNKKIFNIDEFFEKYKNIMSLYFVNTSLDILEPNPQACIDYIHLEMEKVFFNEIYPLLYFNYNLYSFYKDIKIMDSLYGYKNVIKSDIIIKLLKQKGYYIPNNLEKSINLKRFVKEICNKGPIFLYETYFDFTELINAIKKAKFHNKENLNSLFKIRAINYIINGDSLIHIFIDELVKLLSKIDRKELKKIKNISFKIYDKSGISSRLNSSRTLNIQKENNTKKIDESKANKNKDIFKNTKKAILKLKTDKNKKKNRENIYDNKEKKYKFPGLPICGYQGYIPKKKYFPGISVCKIMKLISNDGLYWNDSSKEKENNLLKKKSIKKNDEKLTINSQKQSLSKKDLYYKIKKKSNVVDLLNNKKHTFNFSLDDDFINNKKHIGKKSVYKILKRMENCELKESILNNTMNKIIKQEFCTKNKNFEDSTFCILLGKDLKRCHYYSKRHYQNKKEKLPNVFDSLFSIRKVGFIIELIQNDISEILNPYLKDEDFEKLINQSFQSKTKDEIPENWQKLLSLTNLYPAFGLNNLLDDKTTEEYLGMVKLNKNY